MSITLMRWKWDGSGFAIVTSTMEVEAQSRIDYAEKGDALDLRYLHSDSPGRIML